MKDSKAEIKPVFLLADSQLLFYTDGNGLFINQFKDLLKKEDTKAAYIGASNNDSDVFYELFKLAMGQIGINNCLFIKSKPEIQESQFLKHADIILLAGGDTYKGWEIILNNGWDKVLKQRYSEGAILIGVSAGAIQLGLIGYNEELKKENDIVGFDTLQIVPFLIDVHADDDWISLSKLVEINEGKYKGFGIPFGAGIKYYPDMSIEAVRYPCCEIVKENNQIKKSIILPQEIKMHKLKVEN